MRRPPTRKGKAMTSEKIKASTLVTITEDDPDDDTKGLRTKKLITTASYEKNQDNATTDQQCARCGKDVSNPAGWVHIVGGGVQVLHPDDEDKYEDMNPADLGFYPVGSDCAKHFKGFLQDC